MNLIKNYIDGRISKNEFKRFLIKVSEFNENQVLTIDIFSVDARTLDFNRCLNFLPSYEDPGEDMDDERLLSTATDIYNELQYLLS